MKLDLAPLSKLKHYFLLSLLSLWIFAPGIKTLPVIDRDEAHFAQASRQMVQSANYFQIRFQDQTRFQKPPGINWLQATSVNLFSNAEASKIWPYRLPSLLNALLSILLTYFFSRRLVGASVAVFAAGLLASTLLLVIEAHMAVIDTALLASVIAMQGALWVIYQDSLSASKNETVAKSYWGWALCFWLAMTYGFVLKGVTPLVGILSVVTLCFIERQFAWLRGLHLFSGFILFISLSLSWIWLVSDAEHSNYLLQMIHRDLLPKLRGGHESHGKPPLFHLLILPLTFWPASLFLWQAGVYAFYHRHNRTVKFLLAWIFPTWIFFEIMPTKLPQYVLPVFPAIAVLCALAIRESGNTIKPSGFLRVLQILWGLLSLGLAFAFPLLSYFLLRHWTLTSFSLAGGITILTLAAIYFARQGLFQRASLVVLLMAVFSYPLIFTTFLPQLKPLWLTTSLAELIDRKSLSKEKPLLVVDFEEPSLVFQFNTQTVQFAKALAVKKILQQEPARIAVVEPLVFQNWMEEKMKLFLLGRCEGYNYSKGKWLEMFIVKSYKKEK